MKNIITNIRYKLPLLSFALLAAVYSFAQDAAGSTQSTTVHNTATTSTGPDNTAMWYTAPWVWVVGIVLLLLILIALFRGNNNSKSEVIRTTRTTTEVKND